LHGGAAERSRKVSIGDILDSVSGVALSGSDLAAVSSLVFGPAVRVPATAENPVNRFFQGHAGSSCCVCHLLSDMIFLVSLMWNILLRVLGRPKAFVPDIKSNLAKVGR
jgi:hypothetical protein